MSEEKLVEQLVKRYSLSSAFSAITKASLFYFAYRVINRSSKCSRYGLLGAFLAVGVTSATESSARSQLKEIWKIDDDEHFNEKVWKSLPY